MNRRGFLKMFAGAGVVAATNPVHFLAPKGGWGPKIYSFKDVDAVINVHGDTGLAFLEAQLELASACQVPVDRLFGKTWARDIPIIGESENFYAYVAKSQKEFFKEKFKESDFNKLFLGEWEPNDDLQSLSQTNSRSENFDRPSSSRRLIEDLRSR